MPARRLPLPAYSDVAEDTARVSDACPGTGIGPGVVSNRELLVPGTASQAPTRGRQAGSATQGAAA